VYVINRNADIETRIDGAIGVKNRSNMKDVNVRKEKQRKSVYVYDSSGEFDKQSAISETRSEH
jgi:hypothetical protein